LLTLVHLQCRAGSCPTVERTAVPDEVFRSQPKIFFWGGRAARGHLEHLECSHQPHIQGWGAKKRTQRAG